MPAIIQCWRDGWKNPNMPFLFVQIAPFGFADSPWPELREAQLVTSQTVPNTGLAIITDLGDWSDIHPPRKREVAERLEAIALNTVYGQKVPYSGPVFDQLTINADNAVLTFKEVGSGLMAKGGPLKGFMVAGTDGTFYPAKAEIVGDKVVAWTDKVRQARHVRYNWANYPTGNLYSKDGFPASPFRTDKFPLTSLNEK
jgi:sialate O-acetylesterase